MLNLLQQDRDEPAKRTKEAEKVNLPAIPETTTGFRAWRNAVRTEIAGASGKSKLAFKWILEVEAKDATFESLQDSGKFETLDTKLGASITKLSKGDLGRQIVKGFWQAIVVDHLAAFCCG